MSQTWFEVCVDHELALLLQHIVTAYERTEDSAERDKLLARIGSVVPS